MWEAKKRALRALLPYFFFSNNCLAAILMLTGTIVVAGGQDEEEEEEREQMRAACCCIATLQGSSRGCAGLAWAALACCFCVLLYTLVRLMVVMWMWLLAADCF